MPTRLGILISAGSACLAQDLRSVLDRTSSESLLGQYCVAASPVALHTVTLFSPAGFLNLSSGMPFKASRMKLAQIFAGNEPPVTCFP